MSLGVILFASTHFAMRAEKIAKEKGLTVKLVPVPRQLSSDCGVCLRFSWEEKDKVEATLHQAGVPMENIHPLG